MPAQRLTPQSSCPRSDRPNPRTPHLGWRALILDDDPWMGQLLELRLERELPGLAATSRTVPDCSGTFDLFFVDNRFGDLRLAAELVQEIRRDHPHALVVVCSGQLERTDLMDLVQVNCDLVCEKGDEESMVRMLRDLERLLTSRQRPPTSRRSLTGMVRALADLVFQLNNRIQRSALEA